MKLQHFVGVYANMEAVNIAFPSGGNDGDYLIVDNEIKGWNPYSGGQGGAWETPTVEEKAPVRKTDQVYGDLDVHHDLRVGGKLSAQLIRGKNAFLGLFDTENDLPKHPRVGEWAMVFAYTSTPANAEETPAESEQTQEPASNAETSSENTETRRTENELCIGYIFTCEEDDVWTNTGYKGGYQSGLFEAIQTVQDNVDEEAAARRLADDAEKSARQSADTTLQGNIDAEVQARTEAVNTEAQARQQADETLQGNIDAIESLIPEQADAENQLADKNFVNSSIATATATFRGTFNLVLDFMLPVDATRTQIANKLATIIATADNNDYVFVQVPNTADKPTEILRVERYKYNGTAWGFEYELNNSSFTAAQWAALNSDITAAKVAEFAAEKQRSIAKDTDLESAISTEETRAKGVESNLQQAITSEHDRATTIEGNLNTAISSETTRATAEEGRIEGRVRIVEDKIPSQASAQNQLTDKNYVDSSIATATATHRGSFNLVTDLALPVNATRTQIANRIASKLTELGIVADNNDYVFVQVPNEAEKPLEILRVERYKFNGTNWAFEYELNNSSFTAAQWAALNSGITNTQRETMQADIAANQAKIAALAAGIDVNISFNPSVIYKNAETSVTVTGTMVNGVPTNMKLMDGETVIHEGAASPLSDQVYVNISTNTKTFKVVGESSGVTLSKEGNVAARYPICYGFDVSPSAIAANSLARYAPTTSAAHTYSRENNRDGNHFYILVPSDIPALSSFTMNGAPFVMVASTEVINGITYNVYTSGNTYNAGTQVTVVAS